MKHIVSLVIIFTIGGVGGIFFDRFALPRLAASPLGERYPILRQSAERTTVVNKTEIVRVEESEAIPDLAERVKSAAVALEVSRREKGKLQKIGSAAKEIATGLALTNDGLILLHRDPSLISTGTITFAGESEPLQFIASDTSTNFILLRSPEKRFAVLPFEEDIPRLGSRIFALSVERIGEEVTPMFRANVLSSLTASAFTLSEHLAKDAIMVNFEGRIVAMTVGDGQVSETISASRLKVISEMLMRK